VFEAFVGRIAPGGLLVTCADDPGAGKLAAAARSLTVPPHALRIVTYGESATADYRLGAVTPAGMATEFELTPSGATSLAGRGPFGVRVQVPGKHNALNAAAAYATAAELGFNPDDIADGLAAYRGAQRRMELKGEADSVRVLDSYAHHPTEIAADLTAARDIAAGGRVLVVFQPHLFSRTRIFAAEFGAALAMADEIFVLDVYAAREDPEPGVTGALIADAVPAGRAAFWPDRLSLPGAIADLAKPGDVVLTMGAGDVTQLGPVIVTAVRARGADGGG
jgi:UDP-N-acetylmuramate--alanine ligase